MAASGSFQNPFANSGYALRIGWNIDSQSIEFNTSTVTVTLYLVSLGSYIESNYSKTVTLTINGTKYSSTVSSAAIKKNETRTLMAKTVTVSHDTLGEASMTLSGSFGVKATLGGTYYGFVYVPASGSQTIELETIPRLTTPTTSGTFNVGSAVTINTPRASDTFTHTLQYSLNNSAWTDIVTGVATAYTWTLPAEFATAKPNTQTGTVYIRCITYSEGTDIGSVDISRVYNITSSYAAPAVSLKATQTNSADIDLFIGGKSTVTLTATATLKYDASAAKYVFTYGSTTKTVTTTEAAASVSFALPANVAESYEYSVVVTDSRADTASAGGTLATYAYIAPSISAFTVTRGTGEGSGFVADDSGESLRINISGAIASLSNTNAKLLTLEYRRSSEAEFTALSGWSEATLSAYSYSLTVYTGETPVFDANSAYVVRATVKDSFASARSTVNVPTKKVMMNFSADGESMGIGMIAEGSKMLNVGKRALFLGADGAADGAIIIDAAEGTEGSMHYRQAGATKWAQGVGIGGAGEKLVLWDGVNNVVAGYADTENTLVWNGKICIVGAKGGAVHFDTSTQRLYLANNCADTDYSEQFYLPAPDKERKANGTYSILTSKSPVKISEGGTEATTAAEAREKLEITPANIGAAAAEHSHDAEWIYPTLTNGTTPGGAGSGTLRYKKLGNHVFIMGSVTITPSTSSVTIFTLPEGYRPISNVYKLAAMGGKRIARLYANPSGLFVLEWTVDISDGASYTNSNWVECSMDFWIT